VDSPELAHLKQIELDGPMDQPERGVLARDQATGNILVLPRVVARALLRLKHGWRSAPAAEGEPDPEQQTRLEVAGFLHSVQHLRQSSRAGRKPFNPLFVRLSLFEVAPFQKHLTEAARFAVSSLYIWVMAALAIVGVYLGMQTEWAIIDAYRHVFSPQALLTFAIAAPLLKLFHELGHVLAATRYGVRVSYAGVLFIALFPIPYVDCSDADISANRGQRVIISLAGLFTDLLLGLIIFVAWHFAAGEFMQTLLGNLFVYLTLNSILFNANPLVKLDGYFALIDLIRHRNLSQDGTKSFRSFQAWAGSLGRDGALPRLKRDVAVLIYAAMSFGYRLYIIGFIAYSLLPRYMGVGAAIVAWGLVAMFAAPLSRSPQPTSIEAQAEKRGVWIFRGGALAVLILALLLVRVPVRQDVAVYVDAGGTYAVTVSETGALIDLTAYGPVSEGDMLVETDSARLREQLAERQAELGLARAALEAERAGEQVRAQTASERVETLLSQIAQLEARLADQRILANAPGVFSPDPHLRRGMQLQAGARIGALLPSARQARLSGPFNERYVPYFTDGVRRADVRFQGRYHRLTPDSVALQERVSLDRQTGRRQYVMTVAGPLPASEMAQGTARLRVEFRSEALWRRGWFHLQGLLQNLQDARMSELEQRMGP
jgi:hypothetical protein